VVVLWGSPLSDKALFQQQEFTQAGRLAGHFLEVLQGLFDLTPAEARVARGIGEANTIDMLAETLGVSREVLRSQLKAVLAKTGVARQAELVSLLAGKALPEAER
jgi:DNA-binding CsgD family transcriptional regulator